MTLKQIIDNDGIENIKLVIFDYRQVIDPIDWIEYENYPVERVGNYLGKTIIYLFNVHG